MGIEELDEDTMAAWAWEQLQRYNPGKTDEELQEALLRQYQGRGPGTCR